MKVTSKIFAPHSDIQRQVMTFLAGEGLPHTMWVSCGTKFGKTISGTGAIAYAAPRRPKTVWRWIAPIYKQSRISWRYLKTMWPPEPYTKQDKTNMTWYIPSKEIELQYWHGQYPEDLEGEGIAGQVKDECAKLKEQVHISGRTTLTLTQGRELNQSTPRGKNWFYKCCARAREEMERAKIEKRLPREVFLTAPTSANPFVPRSSIEEAERLLPRRLFEQYYLAKFVDDGSVFPKPLIDVERWPKQFEQTGPSEYWIRPDADQLSVVAGCDWAKTKDFTVLTVWDYSKRPFRPVGFLRMQGKRYTEQVIDVAKFLRRFKACELLLHDKTGVGEAIDDLLAAIPGLVYRGIRFDNRNKAEMVNNLITGMERREVLFPDWRPLLHEFDVFEVQTNNLGTMKYNAPEGDHDDIVTSCYLGYAACLENASADFEVKILEDLPAIETIEGTWENYMYEALDIDPDEGF